MSPAGFSGPRSATIPFLGFGSLLGCRFILSALGHYLDWDESLAPSLKCKNSEGRQELGRAIARLSFAGYHPVDGYIEIGLTICHYGWEM
jgi:hypothetical protein